MVLVIRRCNQFGASGASNKADAYGDCEAGYSGEPEYTLAAVDKSFNHASNYRNKTHAKKFKSYLNVNKNGMKTFGLIVAEEAIRNDPASEGVVAPIMGAADSRAVTARRRKRRKLDASSSTPSSSSEEEEEEEEEEEDSS